MKAYDDPTIVTLGTVAELTQVDKCGGSGDTAYPQILDERFAPDNEC
jgi:hypothetical protein